MSAFFINLLPWLMVMRARQKTFTAEGAENAENINGNKNRNPG
jgi:hypothetical protein